MQLAEDTQQQLGQTSEHMAIMVDSARQAASQITTGSSQAQETSTFMHSATEASNVMKTETAKMEEVQRSDQLHRLPDQPSCLECRC